MGKFGRSDERIHRAGDVPVMIRELVLLRRLDRFADLGLLLLRVLTGAFLVYGVVDNIFSVARMDEFSAFLEANRFVAPQLMAPMSATIQFLCGIALMLGLLTRWAGIIISLHFVVALVMVHWSQDFRAWWPALVLVGIGLQFALTGGGRWSLDAGLSRRAS